MMTRMNRSLLLSPLLMALLLLERSTDAHTGKKFCACLPSTIVFTFDFSLGCSTDISPDDPGIASFVCKVSDAGGSPPTDPVPVVVNDLTILEIGQPTRSAIISTTTLSAQDFRNGSTYTYTTTADTSFPISDDAPKILQVLLTGANAAGEPVINYWQIEFTNQCSVFPVLTPGMQAGWVVFTSLTNPITEVCPASPGPTPTTPAPTALATSEAPSDVPSSSPTGAPAVGTGAPSILPTIATTTAAPVAGTTAAPSAAPTAATAPTATPSAAGTTGTPVAPTTSAPVPAPPASCTDKETILNECTAANFADGQAQSCNLCVAQSFPKTQSNCSVAVPPICTALVTCDCSPCEKPLEDYSQCLLAQAGLACDFNCTLPTVAPAAPLVPSATPAPSPATASDAPSATPTFLSDAPSATPTAGTSGTTSPPTSAATSDAPSDMPSGVPSALTSSSAPVTAAPTTGGGNQPLNCTAIRTSFEACMLTNYKNDTAKLVCQGCVQSNVPQTGTGCDFYNPLVCTAVYSTCTSVCAPCQTELEANVECAFSQAGLPCTFNCTGIV